MNIKNMVKNIVILTALFPILLLMACNKEPEYYGAEPTVKSSELTVSQALEPTNYNSMISVKAKVKAVCKSEGCWTVLSDGKKNIRVVFKDGSFASPMDTEGKTAIVEGKVKEVIVSEEDARLYAENEGKSESDVQSIRGEQRFPIMTAESLRFEK